MRSFSYLLIISVLGVIGTSNASEFLSNWSKNKAHGEFKDRLTIDHPSLERDDRVISLQVAREEGHLSLQQRNSTWRMLEPDQEVGEQRTDGRRLREKACACILAGACLGVFLWIIVTGRARA